ncbi:unnamed protein product [Blepharisma stoltei]|uniref:Uncharacterized protein n=1 Tax=Blepharisma stoltei TaxID=1481888 RepID=A0AAU9IP78_9CILI|nr:unnamed protein product [Blepharisma stoltei]
MDQELFFQVIIVGDTGVGKTCLQLRFSENSFKEQHSVTIGVEFGAKNIQVGSQTIKLQIWDTAGQETYRSITKSFYQRADGVILVYDATARHTFENCENWLEEIRQNSAADVVIFLIGNQVDLIEKGQEDRQVAYEEGKLFAEKQRLSGFIETSAKSGINVNEAFYEFSKVLFERWKERREFKPATQPRIELRPTVINKKKKCCYMKSNNLLIKNDACTEA